ncbi:hypothetical protein [Vogesella oryzae]|uniref:hypothetical protein n=1 Tax=Vogesella oryzae TaxID=1735285 RepID=UPI001581930C|nr:hypothetical protein [Vogesella oryzae]
MKLPTPKICSALVIASCLLATPAAEAISLYSLSESVSATVGSISDSVRGSSKALNIAEGDYKVVDVAKADDKPGQPRLTLQALNDPQQPQFYLFLPQADARQAAVSQGNTVTASKRPYGLAFAKADTTTPFVLVLDQAWLKELQPNIVS